MAVNPQIHLTPSNAKQGDKLYASFGGFVAGASVTLDIQNYGKFPPVVMNAVGTGGFIMTVPNLVNGTYTVRATGTDGRAATQTLVINSTATIDKAVVIFRTYTLPKYFYVQTTPTIIRTTYALDVINIGRIPGTVTLSVCSSVGCGTTTPITLQPGQTQSYTGAPRISSDSLAVYSLRTTSATQTSTITDYIQMPFYNTIPAAGDGAYYPQQANATPLLPDPVIYDQPPSTNPCPDGYHYDVSGHCINDTDGGCLDCGGGGGGGGGGNNDWLIWVLGGVGALALVAGFGKKKGHK